MASPFLHKIHNHKSAVVGGVMCRHVLKRLFILFFILSSPSVSASDMGGIALAFSMPISALIFLVGVVVALMSSTASGYKYIYGLIGIAALIAIVMAAQNWRLDSDIQMYKWHLLLTILMAIPPIILKLKLRYRENT